MKTVKKTKEVSEFARAAMSLDSDFEQLESLGQQLEESELETEFGLNQAKKLLLHYGECGERIGAEIQLLAKALEEARMKAEAGATLVANRAVLIQKRHEEKEQMLSRFQSLGEMAKKVNDSVLQFTNEGKISLTEHMPELQSSIDALIDESKKIRVEASQAKMKTLEKDAEAFSQMLQSVSKRLQNAAAAAKQH
jgi:uncharacterized protein YukE